MKHLRTFLSTSTKRIFALQAPGLGDSLAVFQAPCRALRFSRHAARGLVTLPRQLRRLDPTRRSPHLPRIMFSGCAGICQPLTWPDHTDRTAYVYMSYRLVAKYNYCSSAGACSCLHLEEARLCLPAISSIPHSMRPQPATSSLGALTVDALTSTGPVQKICQ